MKHKILSVALWTFGVSSTILAFATDSIGFLALFATLGIGALVGSLYYIAWAWTNSPSVKEEGK